MALYTFYVLFYLTTGLPWHLHLLDILTLTQAHYYHLITLYTFYVLFCLTAYWAFPTHSPGLTCLIAKLRVKIAQLEIKLAIA